MTRLLALALFLCLVPAALTAAVSADYAAAVELYQQRKPLEAQQAFETLAQQDPENADIQFYLGRLALQRDDPAKAVAYLEKAVALVPNDSRFHLRLGDAYGRSAQKAGLFSKMGLAAKCRAEYEKAVALDPKSLEARFSLLGFYQQAPAIAGGGLDKAHVQAAEIKKLDAGRGRMAIAGLYVVEKKFDLAFAEFETALQQNPDDYAALFQLGRLAAITGEQTDRGLAVLRQCLGQTPPEGQPPHAAAHWRIGNILEKKGDQPGARAAYEAALRIDPKFPQAIDSLQRLK
ncbi:MAG: tetratricopeptide repeat protein [Lacunisphaera sp.]|nr:tetratricopeptide repeat protein [Lacunisphaera sp.]